MYSLTNAARYFLILFALSIALLSGCVMLSESEPIPPQADPSIVIKNISIVDSINNKVYSNKTVVIKQSVIEFIGDVSEAVVPHTAQIIDGSGKFLIPSLWDMHVHMFAFSPLLDMPLWVRYGVTNVRDMMSCPRHEDPIAPCPESLNKWHEEVIAGKRVAPKIHGTASFHANGPGVHGHIKGLPEFYGVETPEQAREFVQHFVGKVSAIKVYNHISRDAFFALAEEAEKLGIDIVGHRPRSVSAMEAAKYFKSFEHARLFLHESYKGSAEMRKAAKKGDWWEDRRSMLAEHDPLMARAIMSEMVKHDTWYVPTHMTRWVDAYAGDPIAREDPMLRYLHPIIKMAFMEDLDAVVNDSPTPEKKEEYKEFYLKGLELTKQAHDQGVKVLAGSDYAVAGISLHRELELLVKAGLSPAEALNSATILPAEYFNKESVLGRVAEGYIADLVVLDGNPLENISNTQRIDTVIFNGRIYDRGTLEKLDQHVIDQAKSFTVGIKLTWSFLKSML